MTTHASFANSMTEPLVSVIVPIYNGEADLPELLRCLEAQTYPRDRAEYWLVDNNSRDRTRELIQAASRAAADQGWTLNYLCEDQIQSSYAARNRGICAARGDWLAFTDADCRPRPDWLEQLVPPLKDPAVGLSVGEITALPGSTIWERHAEREATLSQKHTLANAFCPYGQTANLAVKRQALEQVGLFRPYLTTGGDADLCWRVQREGGWQLRFVEAAQVQHRHRATLDELRSQWRRYGRSSRYLHDLHGTPLMREPSPREYLRQSARWLLKESPKTLLKAIAGRATFADLLGTPIGLICVQARTEGQRQGSLPAEARLIPPLEPRS
jgi:cellulose synthase/poly-beta-1,6-N-acetylglucosamine synthase-like glycosyltransferase